jgi:putative PIG3 family NAD(P)H quinone oxidoreductase
MRSAITQNQWVLVRERVQSRRMSPPDHMTAIEISAPGDPDVLRPTVRPVPACKKDEVLIRVEAAGVSRPDALQRRGLYPPPPGASDIPGLEVAGTVAATSAEVKTFAVGDRVCALVAGGGYAEYCTAPVQQVLPMPNGWSAAESATLPENMFTVWTNLFEVGGLRSGQTVLIHGGTSGIGVTAITLARALGARPFATARGAAKCEAAERLGAELAIDTTRLDFVAEMMRATDDRGVDVVLDIVAGDWVQRDLDVLAQGGRLVIIAFQRGPEATIDIMTLMRKRAMITGSTLRARTPEEKGAIAASLVRHVWPLLEARKVQPIIDARFRLNEANRAHARLESGAHVGKIVLEAQADTTRPN